MSAAGGGATRRLGDYLSLVKFSHSIFALPFALQGAWLASGGIPEGSDLFWIVVCAVAARTAAMGFNRWLDRELDARNPRTAGRELPAGVVSPAGALTLVVGSALVFVAGAWALNPLCAALSPVVLAVLFGYSAFKRFSAAAHFVLGLALAIAPLGAWLAVRGDLAGDLRPVVVLAFGVLAMVAIWPGARADSAHPDHAACRGAHRVLAGRAWRRGVRNGTERSEAGWSGVVWS